jgi:hypothetical protein
MECFLFVSGFLGIGCGGWLEELGELHMVWFLEGLFSEHRQRTTARPRA